jgi:DNA-binding transcriptional MerR regulator
MRGDLSIGEFSQIAHLSVKTLWHYHDAGLLEPAQVGPRSGYRYYAATQIPTAQVIRRLRDLEMPIRQVRDVLATTDPEVRNALIASHLDRLERELDRTGAAVTSLRRLLQLAVTVHRGPHDDIDITYGRLGSYVTDQALAISGPVRETYLVGPRDTQDTTAWRTEIGWPIFRTSVH